MAWVASLVRSVSGFHPGANCSWGEGGGRGTIGAFLYFHNSSCLLQTFICVFLLNYLMTGTFVSISSKKWSVLFHDNSCILQAYHVPGTVLNFRDSLHFTATHSHLHVTVEEVRYNSLSNLWKVVVSGRTGMWVQAVLMVSCAVTGT